MKIVEDPFGEYAFLHESRVSDPFQETVQIYGLD